MKFSLLANYFFRLEETASRNAMTEILAELFSHTSAQDVDLVCYLSLGRLVPRYQSLEFQLAEKMVIRILAQAFDVGEEEVQKRYKAVGDLGEVAQKFKRTTNKLPGKSLTVSEVYRRLRKVAEEAGEGSQQRKVEGLVRLLGDVEALSCRYVIRMVLGRLRLGFSDATILDALSWMSAGDKSLRKKIEQSYFVRADVGEIAKRFTQHGLRGLQHISVQLGVPVMPALCQRLKSADEMIEKMGTVVVEPKYDGQRVQIHFSKSKGGKNNTPHHSVRAFTRNFEEVSFMFPEFEGIGAQVAAADAILDTEAVGFDAKSGKILPFQQIITRKRKHAIGEAAKTVPIRFFVFDVLYKDGTSLLRMPLSKRIEILDDVVIGKKVFVKTERIVTDDPGALRAFHLQKLREGLEGVVVKKLNDFYRPGRRGWSWVKFKEAEEKAAGLADTLDCVVMGYSRGRGKRAAFGIGGFLVGVRTGEGFLTLSKIGTGLTDEQWREMRRRLDRNAASQKPKAYGPVDKTLTPDVWISPSLVVEIAADNITQSPVHSAGMALRFPRLIRFRDDKSPEQATTLDEVKRLNALQKKR